MEKDQENDVPSLQVKTLTWHTTGRGKQWTASDLARFLEFDMWRHNDMKSAIKITTSVAYTIDGRPKLTFRETSIHAPRVGEKVLRFLCTPDRLEEVLGDFEEGFHSHAVKFGVRSARRWYYWQVVRAAAAFAWPLVKRLIKLREFFEKLGL